MSWFKRLFRRRKPSKKMVLYGTRKVVVTSRMSQDSFSDFMDDIEDLPIQNPPDIHSYQGNDLPEDTGIPGTGIATQDIATYSGYEALRHTLMYGSSPNNSTADSGYDFLTDISESTD